MSDLLERLVEANVFKVGDFTLKTGARSPIYIDLRGIIAHPRLVADLARAVRDTGVLADVVCGVPYTALPIASVYSHLFDVPMVMKRKEAKGHGTKKMVEGVTREGATCLVIEDIVTSGSSVIETVQVLRNEGLVVTDCIVVMNREQGGKKNLAAAGIRMHALFNMSDFFRRYCTMRDVDPKLIMTVEMYLKENVYLSSSKPVALRQQFGDRARTASHPVTEELLGVIAEKKSNLCLALDVTRSSELLRVAELLGPHICLLKTHIDILSDFDATVIEKLQSVAEKHNFLIMEDRKFADIGNTVLEQYVEGTYRIRDWADLVTVHPLPGPGMLEGLAAVGKGRACVLVADMSSKGNLTDDTYREKAIKMARDCPGFVIGLVSQGAAPEDTRDMVIMCPGIGLQSPGDKLGQKYRSPEEAVTGGADIIIVGRGISNAPDPVKAAVEYKTRAYNSYMENVE